jgi:hypothetical protein
MAVGRIVRTTYRYKRPPRRKKPVALEVPAVVHRKKQQPPESVGTPCISHR